MDLEDDVALAAVEGAIASVNPTAVIVRTERSAIDLAAILDIRAMAGLRSSTLLCWYVCNQYSMKHSRAGS